MPFYIIRKKGTDLYFPAHYSGRGQTWIDFVPITKRQPRLWNNKQSASSWLTVYCKGPLVRNRKFESDEFGSDYEYDQGYMKDPNTSKVRNRDDYEIVPVTLFIY